MTDLMIDKIETSDLRYWLGYASTTRDLLYRLINNDLVRSAKRSIESDPYAADVYLQRAKEIYDHPTAPGYLHPDDLVLATYIFLLGRISDDRTRNFIEQVASAEHTGFRGATGVARYLLEYVSSNTTKSIPAGAGFSISAVFKDVANVSASKMRDTAWLPRGRIDYNVGIITYAEVA